MINLMKNELLKLKKISFILPLTIIPLLSVIFGSINYYMNKDILTKQWVSLWTQVYFIYGSIFFPVLVGIIVSFIWHCEFNNHAFKLLLTAPINKKKIIFSKIFISFLITLSCQIYFFILYFIGGHIFKMNAIFPFTLFLYLVLLTLFILPILSFQAYISIKINSFVIPVGFSLLLSIFSLLAITQNKLPFLHYVFTTSNLTIAMNHYPEINYKIHEWFSMIVFSFIIFIFFFFLQNHALKKKI